MTEQMVMATRGRGASTEAEPVLLELTDGLLTIRLDDGERLTFDFDELLGAVTPNEIEVDLGDV